MPVSTPFFPWELEQTAWVYALPKVSLVIRYTLTLAGLSPKIGIITPTDAWMSINAVGSTQAS